MQKHNARKKVNWKAVILVLAISFILIYLFYRGTTGFFVKDIEEEKGVFCVDEDGKDKIPCSTDEDCRYLPMNESCNLKGMELFLTSGFEVHCNSEFICGIVEN